MILIPIVATKAQTPPTHTPTKVDFFLLSGKTEQAGENLFKLSQFLPNRAQDGTFFSSNDGHIFGKNRQMRRKPL